MDENGEEDLNSKEGNSSGDADTVRRPKRVHWSENLNSSSSNAEDETVTQQESTSAAGTSQNDPNSTREVEDDWIVSDNESDEEHPVLKKPKPKHGWFVVPELVNRQMGYSARTQSSVLFQRRCYGSLHCAQRLELMYKLEKHDGCVNSLNFHPNGSLLASGSDDLKVVIWDWKYGVPLLTFKTKHRANVFQSKFLPLSGDLHVATCARDGQVRLTQVSAQEGVRSNRKLGAHKGACHKLTVINSQPHVILSAGEDAKVLLHDVRNNQSPNNLLTVCTSTKFPKPVALYSINSHPLNSYEFCVSGRDNSVRTYDQRKCGPDAVPLNSYCPVKLLGKRKATSLHVTCALYNHDGSEILASYSDEDIYTFDVNRKLGAFKRKFQGHRNGATIKGVNYFGPKSEFVISGSDCGNLFIWDTNTGAIVNWMVADDSGVVNCLEPHPQLPFLCTSGLDFNVKVWVPSCESDPVMLGLNETIKNNALGRLNYMDTDTELYNNQVLWILWRHLRTANSNNNVTTLNSRGGEVLSAPHNPNSSSDSTSSSSSDLLDHDLDEFNSSAGCTTS